MKRNLKLFILSILIIGISIILINYKRINNNLLENKEEDKKVIYNGIAIMLEQEDDNYTEAKDNSWQNDEYEFNKDLSKCENGGILSYNSSTHKITLKATGSDRCYVYFDKTIIAKNIEKLVNDAKSMTSLSKDENYNNKAYSGELVYHDGTYKDTIGSTVLDAADGGYRYSGDNPNNFVCFGSGAENYNSNGGTCEDKNLYRIIGIVPVETADGNKQKLIKLIQSEYVTHEQLGKDKADGKPNTNNNEFTSYKRIKSIPTEGFRWNDIYDNTWDTSTLKIALNEEYIKYLQENNNDTTWTNKIENVKWNVGGLTNDQRINLAVGEIKKIVESENDEVSAQIGLMYLHDFGFASDKSNWNIQMSNSPENNKNQNWLFNGIDEWTITRCIDNNYSIINFDWDGSTGNQTVFYSPTVLRPTFYLKQDVELIGGNGTALTPYKIKIDN